jgi:hypothetical protein
MYEGSCLCRRHQSSPGLARYAVHEAAEGAHTWVSDKASWEPIADDLPQFAEWAPTSVLAQKGTRRR